MNDTALRLEIERAYQSPGDLVNNADPFDCSEAESQVHISIWFQGNAEATGSEATLGTSGN